MDLIGPIADRFPNVKPHLKGMARWAVFALPEIDKAAGESVKTIESYTARMKALIRSVYNGDIAGQFIDAMAVLIARELTQAYTVALQEDNVPMNDEMRAELEDFILNEYSYVDQLYRDIVDARLNETPVDQLLARASLWARRWQDVYNAAKLTIARLFGGKLMWKLGATEEHCESCSQLNGLVAFASEWDTAGIRPQNPPNDKLECGGWRCDCALEITTQRRSPKVLDTLLNIAVLAHG